MRRLWILPVLLSALLIGCGGDSEEPANSGNRTGTEKSEDATKDRDKKKDENGKKKEKDSESPETKDKDEEKDPDQEVKTEAEKKEPSEKPAPSKKDEDPAAILQLSSDEINNMEAYCDEMYRRLYTLHQKAVKPPHEEWTHPLKDIVFVALTDQRRGEYMGDADGRPIHRIRLGSLVDMMNILNPQTISADYVMKQVREGIENFKYTLKEVEGNGMDVRFNQIGKYIKGEDQVIYFKGDHTFISNVVGGIGGIADTVPESYSKGNWTVTEKDVVVPLQMFSMETGQPTGEFGGKIFWTVNDKEYETYGVPKSRFYIYKVTASDGTVLVGK